MKDCNHPQLQKIKKHSSMTVKCPDCKKDIFFLSDRVRELLREEFHQRSVLKQLKLENSDVEIGSLYGVPVL